MSKRKRIAESAYETLRLNEDLLRLLYYPPQTVDTDPDPLSSELRDLVNLENVVDRKKYWDIVNNHILKTSKIDDLEEQKICRAYVYAGRTRGTFNKRNVKQEIVVDVFVHLEIDEADFRLAWIGDQLNKTLLLSKLEGGLGRVDYHAGHELNAPTGYLAYRHIYVIGNSKW